jgi:hypothetical protein
MEVCPYHCKPNIASRSRNNRNPVCRKQIVMERSWISNKVKWTLDIPTLLFPRERFRVKISASKHYYILTVNVAQIPNIMELMDTAKYSIIGRLLRVTAYVLRFISRNALRILIPRLDRLPVRKLTAQNWNGLKTFNIQCPNKQTIEK